MNDPSGSGLTNDPLAASAIVAAQYADDDGLDTRSSLPADHAAWQRDVLAVSARVRAVLGTLRPLAVRVVTFWDHLVRSIRVGGDRSVEIDPSGCYRLR